MRLASEFMCLLAADTSRHIARRLMGSGAFTLKTLPGEPRTFFLAAGAELREFTDFLGSLLSGQPDRP